MDIATGLGLLAGGIVLVSLILMGGNLGMFADAHAAHGRARLEQDDVAFGVLHFYQRFYQ